MVQPFINSYTQAIVFATVLQITSFLAVWFLPSSTVTHVKAEKYQGSAVFKAYATVSEAVKEVFDLAIAAPAAAKLILFFRFGLSVRTAFFLLCFLICT